MQSLQSETTTHTNKLPKAREPTRPGARKRSSTLSMSIPTSPAACDTPSAATGCDGVDGGSASMFGWLSRRGKRHAPEEAPVTSRSATQKNNPQSLPSFNLLPAFKGVMGEQPASSPSCSESSTCAADCIGAEAHELLPPPGKKQKAREVSTQRIETGARIHLKVKRVTVAIERYDAIGRRYLLRDDFGNKWYETLDGPGALQYRLMQKAYKPPLPRAEPKEGAMPLRSARGAGQQSAQLAAEAEARSGQQQAHQAQRAQQQTRHGRAAAAAAEAASQIECGICLEVIHVNSGEDGRMPCCDKLVHTECIARWRRESMMPRNARGNGSKRNPSDYNVADTRRCPFCNRLSHNGSMSSRRIFSNAAPVY